MPNEALAAGRGSRVDEWAEVVDVTVRVWNVENGLCVRELAGHSDTVFRMALSPDGDVLASASADGTVRFWSLSSGKELLKLDAVKEHSFAYGIDFFPSGKELASFGSDGTVRIFDAASGEELRKWEIERATFNVAISPDGRRVACSRLMAVQIFDAATGVSQGALMFMPDAGLFARINALAWTPDGLSILAADGSEEDPLRPAPVGFAFESSQSIRVWDASSGKPLAKYVGHVNAINDVAVSRDGKTLVSASADGSIRYWKMPD
ncbi:MAG TPA: WD40 repeat domain-containing protein [Tepidisphaeraceae bacterium]|nr:WD40 repeat domain-containing protein [Tepidisphaeraceae bacterium]